MAQNNNAIATISSAEIAQGTTFTPRQVDLIREQIADGASDDELMLFIQVASSRGLDPFRKHIYAVPRWDSKKKRNVMAYQVSIDGLRLIAERSGKYEGQTPAEWCGPDGKWTDVWLSADPPAAARVGVLKAGTRQPIYAIALYRTFVQKTREGNPTKFWTDMPEHMLAKCAESQALRKAFPEEAGGLYTSEEMHQADNPPSGAIDTQARVVSVENPERQRHAKSLWDMAHGTWKWDQETLDQVAVHKTGKHLADLDAAELQNLYMDLVGTSPEERDALLDTVMGPTTEAAVS